MQTGLQFVDSGAPSSGKRPTRRSAPKTVRGETVKAIHATWKKVFHGDKEEIRAARLSFCEKTLGLRRKLKSMSSLSGAQLGRVIDEMRRLESAPGLPGFGAKSQEPRARGQEQGLAVTSSPSAEVFHLATKAQTDAIGKLIRYLGWSAIGAQAFIAKRYGRTSERMLTPDQANSLTMVLFNIAGAKAIKARGFEGKIPRSMIRQEIPRLKRELGIDQKPSADFADFTEEEF